MDVFTNLTAVIILQYIRISNHVADLKTTEFYTQLYLKARKQKLLFG